MRDESIGGLTLKAESTTEEIPQKLHHVKRSQSHGAKRIAISATFTADLLRRPLEFWANKLDVPVDIALAPYAQVLQQLLDPTSLICSNSNGFNAVLVRLEDWIRERSDEVAERNIEHLQRSTEEFAAAITKLHAHSATPLLVFVCPPSSALSNDYRDRINELQSWLTEAFRSLERVHCWSHDDLVDLYPVAVHEDSRADRIGHIPYTNEYFVAIATLFARRIAALSRPPIKVIAVDGDNTLWTGICGEDGADGVRIMSWNRELQRMLIRQHDAGVLLCVCSKNNKDDVDAVFKRPDMLLSKDHFITVRVNWSTKSSNLRSIADELELGLDSIMFLDDSPAECAEVQGQCPEVLVLQVPGDQQGMEHFLRHVWAFDRVGITEEAKQRTAQYRQNQARKQAALQVGDLQEFLAALELNVEVVPFQLKQLTRVAELVQRTNQFNLNGLRPLAGEIEALWKAGAVQVYVCNVRDRFGDYGLVGAVFLRRAGVTTVVDGFVLSCRVLGRGVEYRVVNRLADLAAQEGANHLVLPYKRLSRNEPARQFLEKSFSAWRVASDHSDSNDECTYVVPVTYAACVTNNHSKTTESTEAKKNSYTGSEKNAWHGSAYPLAQVSEIIAAIQHHAPAAAQGATPYVGPRNQLEALVAGIWADVLGLTDVSVRTSFFELGGDSILAVRVIARLGYALNLELPIDEFFEAPTVESIAERLEGASKVTSPIQRTSRAHAPLSWAQQSFWFIDQLEGGSSAYHIPIAVTLRGHLDPQGLQFSLDEIVRRHEVLRTVFPKIDGEPVQYAALAPSFKLTSLDLQGSVDPRGDLLEQSRAELLAPFEMQEGPLIRGRLLRLSADEHVLLITMHHIIADGWSVGVVLTELATLYESYARGRSTTLPELPIQYADYAIWQRQRITPGQLRQQLTYWKDHLDGAPQLLELPTDRPRPAIRSYHGASIEITLGDSVTTQLKELSRSTNVTLATILFGAWSVLIARLSGREDIVIGVPVSNRTRAELEGLVGLFVNTVALRMHLEGDPSVFDVLQRASQVMISAYANQEVPFEHVVEALQPQRSRSFNPIFQTIFAWNNFPRVVAKNGELEMTEEEVPLHAAQFDVGLSLRESGSEIRGKINYATDIFDAKTVERWGTYFSSVVTGFVREPHSRIGHLELISAAERRRILQSFNVRPARNVRDSLIHELFEYHARGNPDRIAIAYDERFLTYRELNAQANQLARYLKSLGVRGDDLVAIFLDRGFELVIGMLAVLKAGGAYVPIDPGHPVQRIAYTMSDAAPAVTITRSKFLPLISRGAQNVIEIDAEWAKISLESVSDLGVADLGLRSRNLAYVIYTSGSTGLPKGVMVEHRDVVNLWQGLEVLYDGSPCDRIALNAPVVFDASVQQFVQLLSGRTLFVVPDEARRDASRLLDFLAKHRICGVDCTPSQLTSWIRAGLLRHAPRDLQLVLVGGEAIDRTLWSTLAQCSSISFFNVYGPTECTVDVTAAKLSDDRTAPHIGVPMRNRRVYILDQLGRLAPIGVKGEVFIGGVGVGRGYLKRPMLTAERFLADPFGDDLQLRMYRTGDIGSWREDGVIEYFGRNDHQVKIRGFRLELGEIEAQLINHTQVREAVVVAREDEPGEKRLVAYVSSRAETSSPSVENLRSYLKGLLPDYMVPTAFVILDRLPLTLNGKVDRDALPRPGLESHSGERYEPPQGEIEEILASVWQGLLHVERVGRRDNFFELGGHSLLIVQLRESLNRVGLSFELRQIFDCPTLADLAAALSEPMMDHFAVPPNLIPLGCTRITPEMLPLVQLTDEHIEQIVKAVPGGAANVQDIYPLAPLQEGILFHHLFSHQGCDAYLVPTVLKVASRKRLDELIAALNAVIERYDVLRTAVLWENLPEPVQVVYRTAPLPITEEKLDLNLEPLNQVEKWLSVERQWMDLRKAPLLRLHLGGEDEGGQWYVMLQFHHIIGDYTSRETLMSEVTSHLEGMERQFQSPAPYRNHVAQALAYARTRDADGFFRGKLGDIEEPTAPFGFLDVHGENARGHEAREQIGHELSMRVREQARRFAVTAATLFHAAWGLVIAHTSNRDDVVFGSVLSGRLQSTVGSERGFGMFINTLPMRLKLPGLSARQLLEVTEREIVGLLDHEQASLARAQRCSGVVGSVPLFTSILNFRQGAAKTWADWSRASGINLVASRNHTNYPIAASVDDDCDAFALTVQTVCRINALRVASYLHVATASLVAALENTPDVAALSLAVMTSSEYQKVTTKFNATEAEYPRDVGTHLLFEQQVERTPNALVVLHAGPTVTYRQLNARANRLARYLQLLGVRATDYVPIRMSRSLQMLVAQIAILKCGGAYVPIDPNLSDERMAFIVSDCGAKFIISDVEQAPILLRGDIRWINCTREAALIERESEANLRITLSPNPAAYVMYTSGSSGAPKGVIVPHRAVNRLVINNGYARITSEDCLVHYSNPSFDASTFEIWGALLNGAKLVIVPQHTVLELELFSQMLAEHRATILWITVGLFNRYVDALAGVFPRMRYVLVGGDSLEPGPVRRVLLNGPPQKLLNGYGPTEGTTFSTTYNIEVVEESSTNIPIGSPIANTRVYILDHRREPVPIGVVGELYISGDGVAYGYLNRAELTSERFVPDPFSSNPGARMYRSGDLGRWREDGSIEFLGRNDRQVKLRGFRVELGEVEAHITGHHRIQEAVVVVRQGMQGEKQLVAYAVPAKSGPVPTVEELRASAKAALPEYMVPSAFVLLERLPLTANGKVDRAALPQPELGDYAIRSYAAPAGELEASLARIFQETLGVERIGRDDSFFDLGGHSLLALKALVKVNQNFVASLRVVDLYGNPTVRELAAKLRGAQSSEELVDLGKEAELDDDVMRLGQLRVPPRAVLLTGATGFVGRFLLAQLASDTDATIYCMVRARTQFQAEMRLKSTLSHWDLWSDELNGKVVAVPGDLRLPGLGLSEQSYQELAAKVDVIYHCATSMNHLETYTIAKAANVTGTKEILRFATKHKPKLLNYVSTLSIFSHASCDFPRVISESSPIDDEKHSTSHGYAASKWVAEKIVLIARSRGIPCNIFRLGFIWADSQIGRYDELQREYRILKTCLLSGYGIKGFRYDMTPTPVDYAARAIAYLGSKYCFGDQVFHISSTCQAAEDVFERFNCGAGIALDLLPMYEWVAEMKELHGKGFKLPALPLIEFAFRMNPHAFEAYREREKVAAERMQFDLGYSHRQLESAGIVAPVFGAELFGKCINDMLMRDPELQGVGLHVRPSKSRSKEPRMREKGA